MFSHDVQLTKVLPDVCLLPAGLWNLVSLFSNLCLFVLMPFAYFFLESEGFAGSKKVIYSSTISNNCIFLHKKL